VALTPLGRLNDHPLGCLYGVNPIIIESLFGNSRLSIVVFTVAIAILAEPLPQYLIPRNAISWGYYCWPFMWGCMLLTCIISWSLSYLLDTISSPQVDKGIYTAEQLEILIKFHERAEKHGALLRHVASTFMRGAPNLDRSNHTSMQAQLQEG
jgi:metal transporter CNNM